MSLQTEFLVIALFQFHSLGIQSFSWYDISIPLFLSVITIQWDHLQASRSLSWLGFKVVEIFN